MRPTTAPQHEFCAFTEPPTLRRRLVMTIQCPSCFEFFEIVGPAPEECPTEWDYDCEVCCRPMVVAFDCDDDGEVSASTRGLSD